MLNKTEMDVYFEENIAEARVYLEAAQIELKKWEQAYKAWKSAAELGELRRMKPPQRQSFASIIKDTILSFPADQQFTVKDVFNAMSQENLDYSKTRLSISAWLQELVKANKVKKIDRGLYEISQSKRRS